MGASDNLLSHAFVTTALERVAPDLKNLAGHIEALLGDGDTVPPDTFRSDPAGLYDMNVFRCVVGLAGTFQALDDARRMIAVFPAALSKGARRVPRDRWVNYHFGYFTISIASVPDAGTHLAATVAQLGVAARHCSAELVMSHDHVVGTPVATALKGLIAAVTAAKTRRNKHVHRADHANVAHLFEDRFVRNLEVMTSLESVVPGFRGRHLLTRAWRGAAREILAELDAEVNKATSATSRLFDSLLPVYLRRSDALRVQGLRRRLPNPPLQPTSGSVPDTARG